MCINHIKFFLKICFFKICFKLIATCLSTPGHNHSAGVTKQNKKKLCLGRWQWLGAATQKYTVTFLLIFILGSHVFFLPGVYQAWGLRFPVELASLTVVAAMARHRRVGDLPPHLLLARGYGAGLENMGGGCSSVCVLRVGFGGCLVRHVLVPPRPAHTQCHRVDHLAIRDAETP